MNTRNSIFSKAVLIITAVLAVVFTSMRIYLMQTAYDFTRGFYTNQQLHNIFRYSLIAVTVVIFAAAYIYIKEEKSPKGLPKGKLITLVSYAGAVVFAGLILYTFAKLLIPTIPSPTGADLLTTVLGVIALIYFMTFIRKGEIGDTMALLASGPALTLLALVFGLYFNTAISYINHSVVLAYATAIFLMLASVTEAGGYLKRPVLKRYLAYAPTAVILSFTLTIPDIIYALTHTAVPIVDIYNDIIIFIIGIFHLARLVTLSTVKEEV